MMSDLPQDLVEEILCRVPATSLKRLRSTCKQWNYIFNDERFSRKHFVKAAKQFLFLTLTEKSTVCLLSINLHNGNPSVEVTSELNLNQVMINQVFHCDGLLLCTIKNKTRIMVWNPCTGQTKWIQTGKNRCYETLHDCVLGYYQDNKSGNKSYKILSYKIYNCGDGQDLEIYDINSNTWKNLDVIPNCRFVSSDYRVSLKGKTYWFGLDENEVELGIFLLSFDYTTERFERLCLPYQCERYEAMSLSFVREEKLSVLLQRPNTSRREIWVTNKIDDETKVMSWSNLLVMENIGPDLWLDISVLVEEEKKVVCYNKCIFDDKKKYSHSVKTLSIVEEDNKATEMDFPVKTEPSCQPFLVTYVPSLIFPVRAKEIFVFFS